MKASIYSPLHTSLSLCRGHTINPLNNRLQIMISVMPDKAQGGGEVFLGIRKEPLPENALIVESYWVIEPHASVYIAIPPGENVMKYYLKEPPLSWNGYQAFLRLTEAIESEVNPREFESFEDLKKAIRMFIDRLLKKYTGLTRGLPSSEIDAIRYYLERNFAGLGHIEPLIQDPNIEDVSCDGYGSPLYVWHRKYESLPTNIVFTDKSTLDDYVVMLVHRAGKHISAAFPLADAMLEDQHRLAATYREEISPSGSTFTIRKFRSEPFSIIDQIMMGTISAELAAYLWFLIDNKLSLMIIGGTGAGKTSLLNSLCNFIRPTFKVVTAEETPELNLPLENWVRLVTRETYGAVGTVAPRIPLFELVRTSLRYRPDYLIVGEIRGEEAYVLFQALATGHGGLSTMHAESLESAVKRLTSPPMNIAPAYIPLMNAVILIERLTLPTPNGYLLPVRRVRSLWEVIEYENYSSLLEWDPQRDRFRADFSISWHLRRISVRTGMTMAEILAELERRRIVLEWMMMSGITKLRDVSRVVQEYYTVPKKVLEKASSEITLLKEEARRKVKEVAERVEDMLEILERLGGSSDINTLVAHSHLDEGAFWESINKLIEQGLVELLPDGRIHLSAKKVA